MSARRLSALAVPFMREAVDEVPHADCISHGGKATLQAVGVEKYPPELIKAAGPRRRPTGLERRLRAVLPREEPEAIQALAGYLLAHARELTQAPQLPEAIRRIPRDRVREAQVKRQLKYRLRTTNPEGWKPEWKAFLAYARESETGRVPAGAGAGRGRPKQRAFWRPVWLLKTFFIVVTGRPQWRLVAELLNVCERTRLLTVSRLRTGWHKRKPEFEGSGSWPGYNAETFLHSECRHALTLISRDEAPRNHALRGLIGRLLENLDQRQHRTDALLHTLIEAAQEKARGQGLSLQAIREIEKTLSVCIPDDILERGPHEEKSRARAQRLVDQVIAGAMIRHTKTASAQSP